MNGVWKSLILQITLTGLLFVLLVGCWNPFAPTEGDILGGSSVTLTNQQSPEEVLENMRYAYIYRDSLIYSQIIDTGFVFIYYDPDLGGSGDYNFWGRDVELRTTSRLFHAYNHFNLIWNATLFSEYRAQGVVLDSLPDEAAQIAAADEARFTKTFDLDIGTDIHVTGNAIFSFRKGADALWRIVRWRDESDY